MTREQALTSAVLSLLDVVEELALGLANGQTPEARWGDTVAEAFSEHRREVGESE